MNQADVGLEAQTTTEASSPKVASKELSPIVLREQKLTQQYGQEVRAFLYPRDPKAPTRQVISVRKKLLPISPNMRIQEAIYSVLNQQGDRVGYLGGRETRNAEGEMEFYNHSAYSNTDPDPEVRQFINQYNSNPSDSPIVSGSVAAALAYIVGAKEADGTFPYARWDSSASFKTMNGVQHGVSMYWRLGEEYGDMVDVAYVDPYDPTKTFVVTPKKQ